MFPNLFRRRPGRLARNQRAFWLNVANGGLFLFAETFMDPSVVLVWFISHLTSSNLLIGAITPLSSAGWFLPQVFISGWLQTKARKMPTYRKVAVIRVLFWFGLVVVLWTVSDATWLLIGFYLSYAMMKLMSGFAGIPFVDVTAKTVPMQRRGRLFGLRFLAGGILGLLGTRLVSYVLGNVLSFPRNYALLFFIALISGSGALLVFALTREPPGPTRETSSVKVQLHRGFQALKADVNYRQLLLGRACLFLGFIVIPFYTLLAQRELAAPATAVGNYLALTTGTTLVVNFPWGWLLDRKGMQWGMRAVSLGWGVTALFAMGLAWAAQAGWLATLPFPPHVAAYPLFLLRGLFNPVGGIAGQNLLLEIAPKDDRTLYVGFANTLMGVVLLLSSLAGGLMDLLGIQTLFAFSVVMNLLAFLLFGKVRGRRRDAIT